MSADMGRLEFDNAKLFEYANNMVIKKVNSGVRKNENSYGNLRQTSSSKKKQQPRKSVLRITKQIQVDCCSILRNDCE